MGMHIFILKLDFVGIYKFIVIVNAVGWTISLLLNTSWRNRQYKHG
jgi:hypothetical protein